MSHQINTQRVENEASETKHEQANNVSATPELPLESAVRIPSLRLSTTHRSRDGFTNHATDGDRRNGTSKDASGGTLHARTPSLILEIKSRIKDSATSVHDIVGATVANTSHKVRSRRDSVVGAAQRDQIKKIDEQNKTGTDLSMYDRYCTRTSLKLHREISKNHFDDENRTGFLSRSRLLEILTVEKIEKELRKRDSFLERRPELLGRLRFLSPERNDGQKTDFRSEALKILGKHSEKHVGSSTKSYVIILAILILIERPARIKLFIDAQVCDDDLPLAKYTSPKKFILHRPSEPDDALHCFHKWSDTTMIKFEKWQWAFLAPSFALAEKMAVPHYEVRNNQVLPFKPSEVVREGGFGKVRKVAIHKDHREFGNDEVWNFFAIKTLVKNPSRKDFDREVAVLRRFSGDFHKHLISILATFEKDEAFHMIFPWAEADLSQLWESYKTGPAHSDPTLKWMAQQCQGLAEGLKFIHSHETFSGRSLLHPNSLPLYDTTGRADASAHHEIQPSIHLLGRHSDLKPENILWFPDPNHHARNFKGTLKIADFGFVEFSRKTMVDKGRRGFVVRSPTYLPPEVELENNISSLYDIWSLGCIYLEFVAWWLGGHDYMKEFGQSRLQVGSTLPGWAAVPSFKDDLFFQVTQENGTESLKAEVKDSVTKFIKRASDHRNSSSFIKAFLQIIEEKMIVVLGPGGGGRSSAVGVRDAIQNMRQEHLQYSGAEEE